MSIIEEWVKQSRAEQRQKFGDVGLKKDCSQYYMKNGYDRCLSCTSEHHSGRLPCECGVCYFYNPKE